jgi:hypothetical protein
MRMIAPRSIFIAPATVTRHIELKITARDKKGGLKFISKTRT